jgi:DNA polymerase-3 subunit chi
MTERIDFYILPSTAPERRWRFACRLTEKAYLENARVVIWSATDGDARTCDELLWTFDDHAFVPHRISRDEQQLSDRSTPVHLTLALDKVESADLLVNLADRLPEGLPRFTRVAEIIDADEERRRLGRERFKVYRDRKLALETHQCRAGEDASRAAP